MIIISLILLLCSFLLLTAGWWLEYKFGENFFSRSGALLTILIVGVYLVEHKISEQNVFDSERVAQIPVKIEPEFLVKWTEIAKKLGYKHSDVTEEVFLELQQHYYGLDFSASDNLEIKNQILKKIEDRKKALNRILKLQAFLVLLGTFIWGFGDLIFRFFNSKHVPVKTLPF